ncbi:MAG: branched chain amino acid aminotransferase, partial [Chitinophagaceae bacterium]
MVSGSGIKTTRAEKSKLSQIDFNNLPFGKIFTDHMLVVDYDQGKWGIPEIKPYQPIMVDPSMAAIHYGQSIFEGIKAYKNERGEVTIFRPKDNHLRFNISAKRMEMPAVPEEIFMDGMRALVDLERDWIPNKPEFSLYIRPFMFATELAIGVKPSDSYKFMIILSPSGPYYSAPVKIYVEEHFTRACPGGVGFAKAAGNYA